jgi:hypothetical protein
MDLDELKRSANRTAASADRLSRRFARELASVLRDTERKLPPLLRDVTAGNRTAVVKAAQAHRLRRDLRDILTSAGYDDLAEVATSEPLDVITDRVLAGRRLAQLSAELSRGAELRIAGLKALQFTDLLDEGDELARALWKATVRGVFNARDTDVILTDLAEVLDHRESQIRTLYDTSVSIYGRQVEALQAGDDPETPFLYAGPDDDVTRPFCKQHVGKVYTRAQIDAMDNGQLDNVFLTGGGYNCRHVFMEVSKYSELQQAA